MYLRIKQHSCGMPQLITLESNGLTLMDQADTCSYSLLLLTYVSHVCVCVWVYQLHFHWLRLQFSEWIKIGEWGKGSTRKW